MAFTSAGGAPRRGPRFPARFAGECTACLYVFTEGEQVGYPRSSGEGGICCTSCADAFDDGLG